MPDEPSQPENQSQPDLPVNPELHQMEEYFNIRLKTDTQTPAGIIKSVDELGNSVYTSANKTEATLAGEQAATLIATKEGKDVVLNNTGLLKQIATGDIPFEGIEFGDNVYPIELNTSEGMKRFVVKYIPYDADEREIMHMSGIAAMRIMQRAEHEKPITNLTFVTPILATHDMTMAPFVNDGTTVEELEHYVLENKDTRTNLYPERDWSHAPHALAMLEELREVYKTPDGEEFVTAILQETEYISRLLNEWTTKVIEGSDEFKSFNLNYDAMLGQFVIDTTKIMDLFEEYKNKPEEWRIGNGFSEELMKIMGVVELAAASAETENQP